MTSADASATASLALPTPVVLLAPRRRPPALSAVVAVHAGLPRPLPVAVDAFLLCAVTVPLLHPTGLGVAALALLLLVASGRVYRDRDRVVARGTGWWPGVLAGPLGATALLSAALLGVAPLTALLVGLAQGGALLSIRLLAWVILSANRRAGRDVAPALVVGRGDQAATLGRTLSRHTDIGLRVGAVLPASVAGDPVDLARAIRRAGAAHVFVVSSGEAPPGGVRLRRALGVRAHVSLVPALSDALLDERPSHRVGGVAVLPLGRPLQGPGRMPGKRPLDVVLAVLLLTLAAPTLLVAAAAIRLGDGGPVLFRQRRTGRDGQSFDIVKLRTMRVGADGEQGRLTTYNTSDGLLFKMTADPRVTRVGRWLRRSGLDELPQLLNVLRGQMSLVGPRPLPVAPQEFSARDNERHLVRPGMTGLWQVSGGATLRYREMVDLDLAYVHGWSPGLDLRLLLSTVAVLLRASTGRTGLDR